MVLYDPIVVVNDDIVLYTHIIVVDDYIPYQWVKINDQ